MRLHPENLLGRTASFLFLQAHRETTAHFTAIGCGATTKKAVEGTTLTLDEPERTGQRPPVAAMRAQTSHAGPPPAGLDTTVRQMPSPSSARHALRALRPRGQRSVVSDQLPSSDQRNCCFCVHRKSPAFSGAFSSLNLVRK